MLNATGRKYDADATPVLLAEIRKHKRHFNFDFSTLTKDFVVYKITLTGQPDIIEALVAFRATPGCLECKNMEVNIHNQGKNAICNWIGKSIVALCCKYSMDNGMYGNIFFDAKHRLTAYYGRMGAKPVHGICMAIDTPEAIKLIDLYF